MSSWFLFHEEGDFMFHDERNGDNKAFLRIPIRLHTIDPQVSMDDVDE